MATTRTKIEVKWKMTEANEALISGLILGWSYRLDRISPQNNELDNIIKDMKQWAKDIAKNAGVTAKL